MKAKENIRGNIFSPLGSGLSMFCLLFLMGKTAQVTAHTSADDIDILKFATFYACIEYILCESSFNQASFFAYTSPYMRQTFNYVADAIREDLSDPEISNRNRNKT